MPLNEIYVLSTLLALCGWVILLAFAFNPGKVPVIALRGLPLVLSIVYATLMFHLLPFEGGSFSSIDGIASMFSRPEIALVGWIHYLAFDLFIGGWQLQTARREFLPKGMVAISLLLTMVMGPAGLLFFLLVRFVINSRQGIARVTEFEAGSNSRT